MKGVEARAGRPIAIIVFHSAGFSAAVAGRARALKRSAMTCTCTSGCATVLVPGRVRRRTAAGAHDEVAVGHPTSRMGSNQVRTDIPRYLDFYRQGRLLLDEMVTQVATELLGPFTILPSQGDVGVEVWPPYEEDQTRTAREIPVVIIERA